ncbi:hypothetical protein [Olleya sp. HaHaR_3_96]|uniref:hypothetical protein n=1 Tax=Olleya sp. HaHaR_3_96 TaxID=2745560 RepID=UPI001C4F0E31|nr:hypothetical protein [Olleya sp. HaHaR_3_96]QXP61542.1 hypothetical protein H0I26_07910 [Olleya sp. HaHaR_3_96]
MKKTLIILIVLTAGMFLYNKYIDYKTEIDFGIPSSSSEYKKNNNLSDNEAVIASQKFVERQLKTPSTAKFPALFKAKVKKKNGSFIITSYVDSQNGFGAMIRSNYTVELNQKPNGDVSLIDIKIE